MDGPQRTPSENAQEMANEQLGSYVSVHVPSPSPQAELVVKKEQEQSSSRGVTERMQIPPSWLLPVIIAAFLAIAMIVALSSLLGKEDKQDVLVILVMMFILVNSLIGIYLPSRKAGVLSQFLVFMMQLFSRRSGK